MRKPYFFAALLILFVLNQAFTGVERSWSEGYGEGKGTTAIDTTPQGRFENYVRATYATVFPDSALDFNVFRLSMIGQQNLGMRGKIERPELLTVIDFSKPSSEERMYIIDLSDSSLVKRTLVAHGMRSGGEEPYYFSNKAGSKKSSIGFYVTGETYNGKHRYSLKLDGQDPYYNTNARYRGIVFHGADYVSHDYIERNGRLGRSFGCPAIPRNENQEIVDLITGGTCVFIYAENQRYLNSCRHLDIDKASQHYIRSKETLATGQESKAVSKS